MGMWLGFTRTRQEAHGFPTLSRMTMGVGVIAASNSKEVNYMFMRAALSVKYSCCQRQLRFPKSPPSRSLRITHRNKFFITRNLAIDGVPLRGETPRAR